MKNTSNSPAIVVNYLQDKHLNIHVRDFLKRENAHLKAVEALSVEQARETLNVVQSISKIDLSGVEVTNKTIDADGLSIQLNIVRPRGDDRLLPAFIFIHGGGWVMGSFATHQRLVRDLVLGTGAVAVCIDYSRSPEVKYPVALHEIYAAVKWVREKGVELNVNGSSLAVVGDGAGANMATALCLMHLEKGDYALALQVLLWPVTEARFDAESFVHFAMQRYLSTNKMKWMFDAYTLDANDRRNKLVSPLMATGKELVGMPPALIVVAENDILRDQGEHYGRKLRLAGVKATTVRYNGMIHDFGLINTLSDIRPTKSMCLQVSSELKKYLYI